MRSRSSAKMWVHVKKSKKINDLWINQSFKTVFH